jgi:RNA polymerase primary sigma factor
MPKKKTLKGETSSNTEDDTLIVHYLTSVDDIDLLSQEEEIELAIRIEAGLLAEEKLTYDQNLTNNLKNELVNLIQDGKNAKNLFLEANLKLVVEAADRYRNQGLDYTDLVQEGNLGLIRAVEKFDYTKEYRFKSYAFWWIRQAITRALADQARTIRIPVHMVDKINKLARIQEQMFKELGREATPEELAKELSIKTERVLEIKDYGRQVMSLQVFSENDDAGYDPLIDDSGAVDPDHVVSFILLQETLRSVLDSLTEREAEIIAIRFGLVDGEPKTLDEIGKIFGVTRERIRQIESKTMSKLRHVSRNQVLRDYLD